MRRRGLGPDTASRAGGPRLAVCRPGVTRLFSPSPLHHALLDRLTPSHAFDATDLAGWRAGLTTALRSALGFDALPTEHVPLAPVAVWRREYAWGRVEKLHFTSEPLADVPAYLALPHTGTPPFPVMLCLQGHSTGMHNSLGLASDDEMREIRVEGGRDFGRQALAEGYAALCIEQRSLGERRESHQPHVNQYNPCHDAALHALMLGRTLLGERVYDVERALDWIATRPELDRARVGIVGNSGGGTVALWAGALLPRIGFVLASCSLCRFRDSLMSVYHCADNYVPGILRVAEMADIAGLIAPRPLLAVTGRDDPLFPLSGVEACFARVAEVYAAHGASDRASLLIGEGGHRFYPESAWPEAHRLTRLAWA